MRSNLSICLHALPPSLAIKLTPNDPASVAVSSVPSWAINVLRSPINVMTCTLMTLFVPSKLNHWSFFHQMIHKPCARLLLGFPVCSSGMWPRRLNSGCRRLGDESSPSGAKASTPASEAAPVTSNACAWSPWYAAISLSPRLAKLTCVALVLIDLRGFPVENKKPLTGRPHEGVLLSIHQGSVSLSQEAHGRHQEAVRLQPEMVVIKSGRHDFGSVNIACARRGLLKHRCGGAILSAGSANIELSGAPVCIIGLT